MGTASATMVITDPPFNLPIRRVQGRGRIKHEDFAQGAGEMSRSQLIDFLRIALSLAAKHSVNGAIHFVFIDWRHIHQLLEAGSAAYAELKNIVVWAKTNAGQGSFYRSNTSLSASTGQARRLTSTTSNSDGTAETGPTFGLIRV